MNTVIIAAATAAAIVDAAGIVATLTLAATRQASTPASQPTPPATPAAASVPMEQAARPAPPPWQPPAGPDHGANYRQMATQGRVFGSHRADDTGEILPPTAYGVATPSTRMHEMPTGGMDTRSVIAAADEARRRQIDLQDACAPVAVDSSRFRPDAADGILGLHQPSDWDTSQPAAGWAQTGGAA